MNPKLEFRILSHSSPSGLASAVSAHLQRPRPWALHGGVFTTRASPDVPEAAVRHNYFQAIVRELIENNE